MKIGIIGGGPMGLALAYRLSRRGHAVTVFEQEKQLGGLATYHDYGPFFWDRFYHVILPSDSSLISFLNDIGLGHQLRWSRTLTGFYVDQRFHSVSSNWEFLRFPLVSLWGKFRLALTILYSSRIRNWQRLEKITVENWLIKTCGRTTYEKIWKPLLLAKLGESYRRVSAVFIWTYITRLFSARDASVQSKESLGYVAGGYKTVWDRLENLIRSAQGQIRTGVSVRHICPRPEGGLWVEHGEHRNHFDKVIFTGPVSVLQKVTASELLNITNSSSTVEYLGVICMVLVTRKPLVPYYVVNIADERIPFTGVIGMSNIVSREETAGRHLTYLPKYVLSDDPLLRRTDEELRSLFFGGLYLMFPNLKAEGIESVHINRAFKVQPLQVLNYSNLVPQVVTQHEDFFVLNTSQFVCGTLNNNEVIRAVDEFLETYSPRLEQIQVVSKLTRESHSQARILKEEGARVSATAVRSGEAK
jgi:protoporphyrinogen oxidase